MHRWVPADRRALAIECRGRKAPPVGSSAWRSRPAAAKIRHRLCLPQSGPLKLSLEGGPVNWLTDCRLERLSHRQTMSIFREVEIKFKVTDIEDLAGRLRRLGLEQITPRTHEMNTLFDQPGRPLAKRGDLFRLRKYGETWLLTHKSKVPESHGPHKTRIETETRVENGEKMQEILIAIGFEPSLRYEKFRSEWQGEKGHVVIDETPIGNFGEIEGPPEWIDEMARDLEIHPEQYITEPYPGLFARWKRESGSDVGEMTFKAIGSERSQSR